MEQYQSMLRAVAKRFAGKRYAFTMEPITIQLAGMTVVVDGEQGHYPIVTVPNSPTQDMKALAERFNREVLHLNQDEVNRLVLQSMRKVR